MIKDLKGQVFGDLTVIEFAGLNKHNKATWHCKCTCGKEGVYKGGKIQNMRFCGNQEAHDEALGKVKDAAYRMANFKGSILTGLKFGELTVGKMVDFHDIYGPIWSCQCSCGVMVELNTQVIRTRARCGRYHNDNIVKRDVQQRLLAETNSDNNN